MRKLTGFWDYVVKALSVCLILFQLYTTGVRLFSDMIQRSIHLAFVLTLVFILKPARKGHDLDHVPWYDVIFAAVSCASCLYVVSIYKTVVYNPLQWLSTVDKVFAVLLVILVLEASRRSVGWTFPVLGIAFLIYAFWGEAFPGMWAHQNFSFNKVFQSFYHGTTGIWGTMLGLSATMLAMFGIFGAILSGTGGAETFIKIGQRVAGRATGGSGKISVIASSLFGMISGSAIGNVVATGVFTIPSMQRAGYSKEWSAAIEAISSTGGQILPPIMGAAAFIMAQLIGVNYLTIAKAALVPAVLYYLSCFLSIHLVSKRDQICGEPDKPTIRVGEYLVILIPLGIFMFYLLRGYTVMMGAFWATIGAVVTYAVWFLVSEKSVGKCAGAMGRVCFTTAIKGTNSIVEMCGILAGSQITISLVSLTGFGVKLSDLIVSLGEGNLFLCLICSMLVCIVLGDGTSHHGGLCSGGFRAGSGVDRAGHKSSSGPSVCDVLRLPFGYHAAGVRGGVYGLGAGEGGLGEGGGDLMYGVASGVCGAVYIYLQSGADAGRKRFPGGFRDCDGSGGRMPDRYVRDRVLEEAHRAAHASAASGPRYFAADTGCVDQSGGTGCRRRVVFCGPER